VSTLAQATKFVPRKQGRFGRVRRVVLLAVIALVLASSVRAGTVPEPVFDAVHGRIVGWAQSPSGYWFAVYVDRKGGDWCGLGGASWRMALVETRQLPVRVVADQRIEGAMCGNVLSWVRAGRFSDGRHQEVAFMLWATPSIGASTYIYRLDGSRFQLVARFGGDRVTVGAGTVTVAFENRGRSQHGEIEDRYRFIDGRYKLLRSH
jgi:hypothetical protein